MKKNSQKIFYQRLKSPTILPLLLLLLNFSQNAASATKSTNSRRSGFYIDNGQNQTIIHRVPRNIINSDYEYKILKLFGLPEYLQNVTIKAPPIKRSAPKFLLNIYKNVPAFADATSRHVNQKREVSSEFGLTDKSLNTIEKSDVIMTFVAQKKHGAPGVKPDRLNRIWFDVRSVKEDNTFLSAELRLYRDRFEKDSTNREFRITVHRVVSSKNGEREIIYVDAVDTEFERVGWITLNISESLNFWINNNHRDNRGLTLVFHTLDGSGYRRSNPEEIGIVGFDGDLEKQPFMAGFFKSSKLLRLGLNNDLDDEDDEEYDKNEEEEDSDDEEYDNDDSSDEDDNDRRTKRSEDSEFRDLLKKLTKEKTLPLPCNRKEFHIDFKELGSFRDWIIAPETLDAFSCDGRCSFPLGAGATKHAMIQALVHLKADKSIPEPCCVPAKLSPISVLYYVDENTPLLKKLENMVVDKCSCQ